MKHIYKICTAEDWEAALANGSYAGSDDDKRDGFVHFSTAVQLPETLNKHFAAIPGLLLIAFSDDAFGRELKWEPSRGGALFPHLYATIKPSLALWSKPLAVAENGIHQLPEELTP